MPYTPKYRLEYADLLNKKTRIDICERDYAGAVSYLTGTDTPLVINWPDEGDRMSPIRGSEARIQFFSSDPYTYLPLFTSGKRKYLVNIYKGNESDDLIKNRGFYGSANNWTLTGYTYNSNAWSVKASGTGIKSIKQPVKLPTGNYIIKVMIANVVSNSIFRIKYDGGTLHTGFISDTGDATAVFNDTFNILSGSTTFKDFEIETDGQNIEITEVQLYPTASPAFNFNLIWSGFLYPSIYQQSLAASPHVIEVSAACGLGQLDKYNLLDDDGLFPVEQMTIYKLLQLCLKNTGVHLPLAAAIPVTFNNVSSNIIKDAKINTQAFEELTCIEILEEFAKLLSGRWYQSDGMWCFVRYEVYGDDISFLMYDATRTHRESITFEALKDITPPNTSLGQGILCYLDGLNMRVELPYKSVRIENSAGYRENIVPGLFTDNYWDNNTPLFWTIENSAIVSREGDAVRIKGDFGAFGTTKRIKYSTPVGSPGSVKIKITAKVFAYADDIIAGGTIGLGLKLRIGDKYLGPGGWSTSSGTTIGTDVPQNQWEDVVIEVNAISTFSGSDNLTLEIYAPWTLEEDESLYLLVKEIEVMPRFSPVSQTIITDENIEDDHEDIADIEVMPGLRLTFTPFEHRLYLASILQDDDDCASDLRANGNVYTTAGNMIADDYKAVFSVPREILSAQIHGYISMNSSVKDTNHSDKKYMIHALSVYDKSAINEVELYEQP